MGALIGSTTGAFLQLAVNIEKALLMILPRTIGVIVKAGAKIAEAIYGFGKTIISSLGKVLGTILSPIKNLFSSIFSAFSSSGGSLGGTIFSSMFKFEVLKQVIRGVIGEIKMLSKESFGAAVGLQTLTIRLDNLIAMQVREAGLTKDYGASIQIASGYTQELLTWIQKMALATPISIEDISRTVSLGLAMKWSLTSVKELTKSIIDYTATLGMGSEISERIIYNFAQMKMQGKVTGTELRDLGRGAFMPIATILSIMYDKLDLVADGMDKTTISFSDFTEQAAAGVVPVEKFFDAFNTYVATAMPDAAYKMNYTFEAVTQNLHDLFKVLLGWNVLGPMIKSITKPLQDFIEKFSSDEVLMKANAIGKAIAFMVDSTLRGFEYVKAGVSEFIAALGLPPLTIENVIKSIVKLGLFLEWLGLKIRQTIHKYLVPFAKDLGDEMGDSFDKTSDDAFTWGAKIIFRFAQGMIKAASTVLTQVMNFITGILTSWLKGRSPPRVAPEIDQWGMETMNEWLHGFTQADFSILSDMQSVIKDALGALVNLGMMTDVQASEEYLSISLDLIEAMDELNRTGTISASIFERLASIGGVFGQEISELLQLQLQYADATRIAEQAQIDFDNAVKATQVATGKSNRLIREYNKLLRGGANKSALKDKLKFVNLAKIELDVARKAEEEKKTALDVAKENLKALQDSLELQKSLIKTMTDLAQAQKDAATAASGGAGAIEDLTDAINDLNYEFTGIGAGAEIDFEGLRQAAQLEFDNMMIGLEASWADMWSNNVGAGSPFANSLSAMKTAWGATLVELQSIWDTFAAAVQLPSWDEITSAWGSGGVTMPEGMDPSVWANMDPNMQQQVGVPSSLIDRFTAIIKTFSDHIKNNPDMFKDIAKYLYDGIKKKIIDVFSDPANQKAVSDAFNNFMTWVTDLILGEEDIVVPMAPTPWAERLGTALIEGLKNALILAINAITAAVQSDTASALATALTNMANAIGELLWDKFVEYIKSKFTWENIWNAMPFVQGPKWVANTANVSITPYITLEPEYALSSTATTPSDWITNMLNLPLQTVTAPTTVSPAITLTPTYTPTPDVIGKSMISGVQTGVDAEAGTFSWNRVWDIVVGGFKRLLRIPESPSGLFTDFGVDVVDGLSKGITDQIAAITWDDIWKVIIDGFKLLFGIGSESTVFKGFGTEIINGLKTGITDTINNIIGPEGALTIAFKNVITAIKGFFGIGKRMDENPFYLIGKSIIDGIVAGLNAFVGTLQSKIAEIASLIPAWLKELLGIGSPSKVFADIGKDMMLGLAEGILGTSKIVNRAISKNIGSNASQKYTMQSPMSASPVYGGTNVTFGDVHLSGNMDFAVFESMFNKMVLKR
jgi:tape measure domain-containing protein